MGINLAGPYNSGAAVGSDGAATASATGTNILSGRVVAVYVRYNDSPPAGTTDVVIATAGTAGPPANTLLTLTDGATDGWRYPRSVIHSTAGVAGSDAVEAIPVHDKITVTIDDANAGDSVDVWLLLEC